MTQTTRPQGLYLHLYHGRESLDQDLDDWGKNGPELGPFDSIVTTYLSTIRLIGDGLDQWLECQGDCVKYQNVYYGDWCVYYHPG